jgi:hypothetical protein
LYRRGGSVEVYVIPPEPQQLTFPKSAMQGEDVKGFDVVPGSAYCLNGLSCLL